MDQWCLGPLVESTAETITSLHEYDFAHLDAWLENICFHYNAAVLIDFEYACDVTTDRDSAPQYRYGDTVSCMFKRHTPGIQTAAHYDWMQLGWMAFWIHNLKSMNDVSYIPQHGSSLATEAYLSLSETSSELWCLLQRSSIQKSDLYGTHGVSCLHDGTYVILCTAYYWWQHLTVHNKMHRINVG